MTSGSNCRHLNKPQTADARRSILPAYHRMTAKLQHFPFLIRFSSSEKVWVLFRVPCWQGLKC
jgi:hypothetical protein